ncbi:MAG: glycosyltransferase [Ardenticatenales bacterium]
MSLRPDRAVGPNPAHSPRRADLHCHSSASNEADEALLNALQCPECYSAPADVYAQAKQRGMDFVTITDHDTIDGVTALIRLRERAGDGRVDGRNAWRGEDLADGRETGRRGGRVSGEVLVGEEVTCWFPEDRCKIHLLVWGITPADHAMLQAAAHDIYAVAAIVASHRIAHSVAHPVYRQNDVLERWHLERLILLFKGFETLNGAHSALHRSSLEPLLDALTPERIDAMASAHGLAPLWPQPWRKARTGGSDDHGLLNIGRTWTAFPADVRTADDVLDCLRTGRCWPGGEAGSSIKLAHNLFSVSLRYVARQRHRPSSRSTVQSYMGRVLVGERAARRRRDAFGDAIKGTAVAIRRAVRRPLGGAQRPANGSALLADLVAQSCRARLSEHPAIADAVQRGVAPLGEHEAMFAFVAALNRDVASGIADAVADALSDGRVGEVFDAFAAVVMQQAIQLPYYFSLVHQNRERHDLARITGHGRTPTAGSLRVGVFTDTFDEMNGVVRFVHQMADLAAQRRHTLVVHTCTSSPKLEAPYRKNFTPLVERPMPWYPQLRLTLPPLLEVLEWADRQQFDAIHVDSPGPMGVCGWLVARMLRVPLLGTYHTDFPAYIHTFSGGDLRLTSATTAYMRAFYGDMTTVLTRSHAYDETLRRLGIADDRIAPAPPYIDGDAFHPRHRDVRMWAGLGIDERYRLFYCGRVSDEKNLSFLAAVFQAICAVRRDVALVIAGDGPGAEGFAAATAGLPVYMLGQQADPALARLYASSDVFVFPSRTDTLGQVILEAQASGLPALVSDEGGPKEVVNHGRTGLILPVGDPATDVARWAAAIDELLADEPRRRRLGRAAVHRMARFTPAASFDAFWAAHARAVERPAESAAEPTAMPWTTPLGQPASQVSAQDA